MRHRLARRRCSSPRTSPGRRGRDHRARRAAGPRPGTASRSAAGRSGSVTTCSRGTSSVWPLNSGRTSRKATKSSVAPHDRGLDLAGGDRAEQAVSHRSGRRPRCAGRTGLHEDQCDGARRSPQRRSPSAPIAREVVAQQHVDHEPAEPAGHETDGELDRERRVTGLAPQVAHQAADDESRDEVGEHGVNLAAQHHHTGM